jgi:hypothetical protein
MPFFGSLGILITRALVVAAVVVAVLSEISTLVGAGISGFFDGSIQFNSPNGVAVDSAGNVYVADSTNQRIRKITSTGVTTTLAGSGTVGSTDGTGTNATFSGPEGITVDSAGTVYVADRSNHRIRKITPLGVVTTLAGSGGISFVDGTGTSATFNTPVGITVDSTGIVYVADRSNHVIRKITPLGVVTTLAGNGTDGTSGGTGTNAFFTQPTGVAVDSIGNVYVTEQNHRIRKITPEGVVTVFAGSTTSGSNDGTGTDATFRNPQGVAVDSAGNVYVAERFNNRIRKITPAGVVTTIAGNGTATFADGTGTNATFNFPQGVAVDSVGNVYVADSSNNRIRKITPAGVVTTFSGIGVAGFTDSIQNGAVSGALLQGPHAVAVDSIGNIYVADTGNRRIRKQTPSGVVTTLAGSGSSAFVDGTGTSASFNLTYGLAVDSAGNIYVADNGNRRIRKITPEGVVTTLAGNGTDTFADGNGTSAGFVSPTGVAVDSAGNVYVADSTRIRKITSGGIVTTLAGNAFSNYLNGTGANANFLGLRGITVNSAGTMLYVTDSQRIRRVTTAGVTSFLAGSGDTGSTNGTGSAASFWNPWGITVNTADTSVYIGDTTNRRIRRVTTAGGVVTTYSGIGGSAEFTVSPAGSVKYSTPYGTAINSAGIVYVADGGNHCIRSIAAGADGSSVAPAVVGAGGGAGYSEGGGWFNSPFGVATDWNGTVYVADTINNRIRKITPAGVVTTFAGQAMAAFANATGTNALFNRPQGVAVDSAGTVYVADTNNHRIRAITSAGVVTTLAGQTTAGSTNGTGISASFNSPTGVAVNSAGIVYVADTNNHRIRAITSAAAVTTFAGTTQGFQDGVGTNARFNTPSGIVADIYGNVYVADTNNHRIRRVTSDGTVTTLAGQATAGYADGTGTNAQFNFPYQLSIDVLGTLYVADQTNNRIRTVQTSTGVVSTLAGDGTAGFTPSRFNSPQGITVERFRNAYVADSGNHSIRKIPNVYTLPENNRVVTTFAGDGSAGFIAGNGIGARFDGVRGIAVDSLENVYVSELGNHMIRKITPQGVITIFAGNRTVGSTDGTGTNATFNTPQGIAVDSTGNVYVGERNNYRIRKITPAGVVSTFAGTTFGYLDGSGVAARFNDPHGITVDSAGNVYVADVRNHCIRKITSSGVVTTLAGQTTSGYLDGTGTNAQFNEPYAVAVDSLGNVYVSDYFNFRIRKITPAGVVTTFVGNGTSSFLDGTGTNAIISNPLGLEVDLADNIYLADYSNHRIRKITPAGVVTTLAGSSPGYLDGTGTNARFNGPSVLTVYSTGTMYVSDQINNRIRKIGTAVAQVPLNRGVVTTFAGSGTAGASNATGTNATFNYPFGITVDSTGNLYVGDISNNRIRKISPIGVVTTLAGNGTATSVNGTGASATFNGPSGVAVDSAGNVYVTEYGNFIRKITPAGVVTTLAGNGTATFLDGTGTNARFNQPYGVAVDSAGTVYVGDSANNRIRKITPAGVVTTLAGSTSGSADGTGTNATFSQPYGVAVDLAGNVYVADRFNHRIRKITPAGVVTTLAGNTQGSADGTGTNATFSEPYGVAVDSNENIYVAENGNCLIRRITPAGVVTKIAGDRTLGFQNGTGTNAKFDRVTSITVDSAGILYVADQFNQRIRKIQ